MNRYGSARRPDGSEQIDAEDMYHLGNVVPHSTGGLNNTLNFFSLFFVFFRIGAE